MFIHAFAAKAECLGAFIDCFIDSAPTWGPKDHETAGARSFSAACCVAPSTVHVPHFFRSACEVRSKSGCMFFSFFWTRTCFLDLAGFFFGTWGHKKCGATCLCVFLDPVKIFFLDLHVFVLDPGKFY